MSIVLLLAVGALTLFDRALRQKYEPTLGKMRKEAKDKVGFFCEQQTLLAQDPWFHAPRTEGDAGPLLNAWVAWDPSPPMPKGSPLTIPAHLPQRNNDFTEWLAVTVDVSTLDFSWMERLHAYDRWDILQGSPLPPGEPIRMATVPLPQLGPLLLWAKFRLLHGLKEGKPVEAARDVRQLAWLMYRSETFVGSTLAHDLLHYERQAHGSMKTPPAEWQPMSAEQIDRMRAILRSSPAFSRLTAPVKVARQARSCGEPVVSRCIALTEASVMAKFLLPLAKDKYREHYEAFATELAERPCATTLGQEIWKRGTTIEQESQDGTQVNFPQWINSLPGSWASSRILGILLSLDQHSLKPLNEFQTALESGRFQPPKP